MVWCPCLLYLQCCSKSEERLVAIWNYTVYNVLHAITYLPQSRRVQTSTRKSFLWLKFRKQSLPVSYRLGCCSWEIQLHMVLLLIKRYCMHVWYIDETIVFMTAAASATNCNMVPVYSRPRLSNNRFLGYVLSLPYIYSAVTIYGLYWVD